MPQVLGLFLQVFGILRFIFSLKTVLSLGKIIAFFKAIGTCVEELTKTKSVSKASADRALDLLEDLLYSEVIDLPGVDENDLAKALHEVRLQFEVRS